MKHTFSVTQEILEESKDCGQEFLDEYVVENCAIALAIKKQFNRVQVGYKTANIDNNVVSLSTDIQDFIKRFDNASPVERVKMKPFTFELEIPDANN